MSFCIGCGFTRGSAHNSTLMYSLGHRPRSIFAHALGGTEALRPSPSSSSSTNSASVQASSPAPAVYRSGVCAWCTSPQASPAARRRAANDAAAPAPNRPIPSPARSRLLDPVAGMGACSGAWRWPTTRWPTPTPPACAPTEMFDPPPGRCPTGGRSGVGCPVVGREVVVVVVESLGFDVEVVGAA